MGTGDGVTFEAHIVDGWDRPRLLAWHEDPGVSPRPIALPLRKWAERDVLIRFGTLAGRTTLGDRARILRPRIARCRSLHNLVQDLQEGAFEVVNGSARVLGDTLELSPGVRGAAVTDVRLKLRPDENACFAVDFEPRRRSVNDVGVALEASIVDGDESIRLARSEFAPDAALVSFKELPLGEWSGRDVLLRFAAWPLLEGKAALAVALRPRIHRCGDGAHWDFDRNTSD
jgi:hypothetical protein